VDFQPDTNPHVSLYVVDSLGGTEDYPQTARRNETTTLTLGGTFGGEEGRIYRLSSSTGSEMTLSLRPGETWERKVEFALRTPGLHEVTWQLAPVDNINDKRTVRIWIRID
jgi:hypothetical protein